MAGLYITYFKPMLYYIKPFDNPRLITITISSTVPPSDLRSTIFSLALATLLFINSIQSYRFFYNNRHV